MLCALLIAWVALQFVHCRELALAQPAADEEELKLPPPRDLESLSPDDWLNKIDEFDRLIIYHNRQTTIVDVRPLEQRPLPLRQTPDMDEPLEDEVRFALAETGEEFKVKRQYIQEVKHFEDLLLEQADKYLSKGEHNTAFDFIHHVATRQPYWRGDAEKGLSRKTQDALFKEASLRLLDQQPRQALNVLHQLRGLNPDYPEAREAMGRAADNVIVRLFEDEREYAQARHYQRLLEEDYPDHSVAKKWRERFIRETRNLVAQAKQNETAGGRRDACLLMLQAARMGPSLSGIDDPFARIFRKYPILHVGVRELPRRFAPWAPPGSGDARVALLLHVPFMEVSGVGENTRFTSRVLDGDPMLSELGRRVTLRIKPGLRWSDGQKPITAMDVARALTARCNPRLPGYNAALVSSLERVSVPEIDRAVVDLRRTELRPQTHFLFNLAAGGHLFGSAATLPEIVSSGPYRVFARRFGEQAIMQANRHFFGGRPKISEIVERQYSQAKDATAALLAGEVALLDHVHPRQLQRIRQRSDLKVVRSAVPALHVISFDFRRYEFHSHTLRRALAYGIDRKAILEQGILGQPAGDGNALANGPFPKGSYAYEPSLDPLPYRPVLAAGLASMAKKELRTPNLRFTLHYPESVEEAGESCRFIKVYLKRNLGIEIELAPRPFQELEEEIAAGRGFDLVYRIHYVRDPVLDAARVLCLGPPISAEGMAMPNCASAWLRQALQRLQLATDWREARGKLRDIQIMAREDVAIIPLWQLNEYYAFHERLQGMPDRPLEFYQGVENWQVAPWFRKDPE